MAIRQAFGIRACISRSIGNLVYWVGFHDLPSILAVMRFFFPSGVWGRRWRWLDRSNGVAWRVRWLFLPLLLIETAVGGSEWLSIIGLIMMSTLATCL